MSEGCKCVCHTVGLLGFMCCPCTTRIFRSVADEGGNNVRIRESIAPVAPSRSAADAFHVYDIDTNSQASAAPPSPRMQALNELAQAEMAEGIYDAGSPMSGSPKGGEAPDTARGRTMLVTSPASSGAAPPSEREAAIETAKAIMAMLRSIDWSASLDNWKYDRIADIIQARAAVPQAEAREYWKEIASLRAAAVPAPGPCEHPRCPRDYEGTSFLVTDKDGIFYVSCGVCKKFLGVWDGRFGHKLRDIPVAGPTAPRRNNEANHTD